MIGFLKRSHSDQLPDNESDYNEIGQLSNISRPSTLRSKPRPSVKARLMDNLVGKRRSRPDSSDASSEDEFALQGIDEETRPSKKRPRHHINIRHSENEAPAPITAKKQRVQDIRKEDVIDTGHGWKVKDVHAPSGSSSRRPSQLYSVGVQPSHLHESTEDEAPDMMASQQNVVPSSISANVTKDTGADVSALINGLFSELQSFRNQAEKKEKEIRTREEKKDKEARAREDALQKENKNLYFENGSLKSKVQFLELELERLRQRQQDVDHVG